MVGMHLDMGACLTHRFRNPPAAEVAVEEERQFPKLLFVGG
jgi:hypothetical protein